MAVQILDQSDLSNSVYSNTLKQTIAASLTLFLSDIRLTL